jgi:hypothetical protein
MKIDTTAVLSAINKMADKLNLENFASNRLNDLSTGTWTGRKGIKDEVYLLASRILSEPYPIMGEVK